VNKKNIPMVLLDKFLELEIFKLLKSKSSDELYLNIVEISRWSLELLPLTINTFKKYTIHHSQHQYNILTIFEKILKDKLNKLTDLELCLLILSALLHDIGMVFTDEEKQNILQSREFELFLNSNPAAKISFIKSNRELNENLLIWFCRTIHAKRVDGFLIKINDRLKYNGFSIRKELKLICESHNWPTKSLYSEEFKTNFLYAADLRFCAILLRISDILDFDYTRSPRSIFDIISFDKNNEFDAVSELEWLKHISSNGFTFGDDTLYFSSRPEHPNVENAIRKFLHIIEDELIHCNLLLNYCSKEHSSFRLYTQINTDNIIGQEYSYGEYSFSLEKDKIVSLLMGENIYSNKLSFARELLQNSIDAINFINYINGNQTNGLIDIWTWEDNENNFWFRIDDNGTGMTEEIIKNYFLKIGNSFYTDTLFNSLIITEEGELSYLPISRFGIGFLSVFLISDLVVINTTSHLTNKKLRLTINGIYAYYILHDESHIITDFPNSFGENERFRDQHGTSIAIRIKDDYISSDIKTIIKSYILSIVYPTDFTLSINGENISRSPIVSPESLDIYFNKSDTTKINKYLKIKDAKRIKFTINICELGANANGNIDGYGILVKLNLPDTILNSNSIQILSDGGELIFKIKDNNEPLLLNYLNEIRRNLRIDISNNLVLSYRGVLLPLQKDSIDIDIDDIEDEDLNIELPFTNDIIYNAFNINLKGKLRPDLPISRERIRKLDFNMYSQLAFSIIDAVLKSNIAISSNKVDVFGDFIDHTPYPIGDYLNDRLLFDDNGWKTIKIFAIQDRFISLNELVEIIDEQPDFDFYELLLFYHNTEGYFTVTLQKILLTMYFKIDYISDKGIIKFTKKSNYFSDINLNSFPPLFTINYDNDVLCHFPLPYNNNNNIIKYLETNIELIKKKAPLFYRTLMDAMLNYSYDKKRLKEVFVKTKEIRNLINTPNNFEFQITYDEMLELDYEDLF